MFYFNIKSNLYKKKGQDYVAPFGLYTIISGSMEPNVSVYDVVVAIDEDISNIKVGDIITFISNWEVNNGLTVTHRVVGITKNDNGEYQLLTKGDNNGSQDGGVVTQHNLVGKVVGRVPQLGRLQFFLATKMGWFLVVFIPALGIIIFDMIKIFKLYVLKSKISNVQPINELEEKKETEPIKVDDILNEKKEEKPRISDVVLEPIVEENTTLPVEDKNIDTVELPKIGEDGKVTENTKEIPKVEKTNSLDEILESNKDDDLMPKLNKNSEIHTDINTRKMIQRRK